MRSVVWILAMAAVWLCLIPSAAAQQAQMTEEEVLARFKHEPSVQQVQDAAIRYYQVHPDRIASLRSNAQLKALVPVVSGGFANALGSEKRKLVDSIYLNLGFKEDEQINSDSMAFTVGATWNLDRLVFNAEVLDVQSLIGILDGVVREVTTIYYIRRRLQIDNLLRPPTDLASKISSNIRIEELTGLLDAMTGGFMSKWLRKARHGRSGPAPEATVRSVPVATTQQPAAAPYRPQVAGTPTAPAAPAAPLVMRSASGNTAPVLAPR